MQCYVVKMRGRQRFLTNKDRRGEEVGAFSADLNRADFYSSHPAADAAARQHAGLSGFTWQEVGHLMEVVAVVLKTPEPSQEPDQVPEEPAPTPEPVADAPPPAPVKSPKAKASAK